ncbi:hypothetical protein M0R45_013208 [Rubus argutus]|uniref:Uncharacterized protein n=1 Tax=Rubus argutus TaxID=59490 RepID=A0AAW1XL10_RUBAR
MGIKDSFTDIYRSREMGVFGSRRFARWFSANESIVNRLGFYQELDGYNKRVGTAHFNSRGDLLVSGGDENQNIIWDWETKTRRLSYDSGHFTVQDTKLMPLSDDKKIATACMDGYVRLGEVCEDGRVHTKHLGSFDYFGVRSLAVEPGDPNSFYSCGEDGFVRQFDLRSSCARDLLHCSRLSKGKHNPHEMALSDIVIDPRNPNYFCTGGADAYARVYDIRKLQQRYASRYLDEPVDIFCPDHLIETSNIWVTGLAYSKSSELVVNYFNDLIYLFQKNVGLGRPSPSSTLPQDIDKPQVFLGHSNTLTATAVSFFGPNDDYVMSGSTCGHIFIWKKNGTKVIRVMNGNADQIEPHPNLPIIATCGSEKNVKLWAPIANDDHSLNIEQLMESNRKGREKERQLYLLHSSMYDMEIQMQPVGEEISDSPCLGWDID